jgi:phosphohistidine swiveling domain-containing protein
MRATAALGRPIEDPLQTTVSRDEYWTTTNTEEAHPGVLTPLGWTVAGPGIEHATRSPLQLLGVLDAQEARIPERPEDRTYAVFGGRFAARLSFFVEIGNRMPGTTGAAVTDQIFSFTPPDARIETDRSRYAAIARKLPLAFQRAPRRARRLRADTAKWWANEVVRTPRLDASAARRQFAEANRRFNAVGVVDGVLLLAAIQPLYEQVGRLAEKAGIDSGALMSGHGSHEETGMVGDLWACSRGRLEVKELIARYGFHGPRTGELSSRSWREDPSALEVLVAKYREMPAEAEPSEAERERAAEREQSERKLIGDLPLRSRPQAALLLGAARKYLPLRGKAGRTQALDVMRAAARRIGDCAVADRSLDDPDDVFFLTAEQLAGPLPADARAIVANRRERYERYLAETLPRVWCGNPTPVPLAAGEPEGRATSLSGIAASPGVAEGRARIVSDPAEEDVEPGEILVAYTTDPSWASIMFVASALVIDVGGQLSHAAIVARELGVPCVMGTDTGTRRIRTGDRIRVDGSAGSVAILSD